jgi:hypothetical protein
MNTNDKLDQLLQALDPLTPELRAKNTIRSNEIWANVERQVVVSGPTKRMRRQLISMGSLAGLASAVALVVGLWPTASPVGAFPATAALTACNNQISKYSGSSAVGTPLELIGDYSSTAGQVTTWDENRPGSLGPNSEFSGWPSSEPVSVCYFSGDFTDFPGPPGAPSAYFSMVIVVQPDGSSTLDFVGPANLGFAPPPTAVN